MLQLQKFSELAESSGNVPTINIMFSKIIIGSEKDLANLFKYAIKFI